MEPKFILFNSLLSNTKPAKDGKYKDLTRVEKEFFVHNIKNVGADVHEIIYAVVAAYSPKSSDPDIPYTGCFVESGVVEFNFNSFPPQLKRMLYDFLTMHLSSVRQQ
tara:strand:- start:4431 stop:4751 length:321 start_codon:yes stop_codon:yes gene_type:complete